MGRVANVADLSTTTVAALVPKEWSVSICDERIESVDLEHPASVIGITGKVSQFSRMVELAREFRERGKIVIIGGPYASLNPDDVRPHGRDSQTLVNFGPNDDPQLNRNDYR